MLMKSIRALLPIFGYSASQLVEDSAERGQRLAIGLFTRFARFAIRIASHPGPVVLAQPDRPTRFLAYGELLQFLEPARLRQGLCSRRTAGTAGEEIARSQG